MSEGGSLQQRTTYLISLTLVKVEALEENGGAVRSLSSGEEAAVAASRAEDLETRTPSMAGETRSRAPGANEATDEGGKPPSESKDADAPRTAGEKPPLRRPAVAIQPEPARTPKSADLDLSEAEKIPCAPEAKHSRPPLLTGNPPTETPEPVRTPTRTSLPIRPLGQRPVSLVKSHGGAAPRGRDSREGRDRSPASAQSLDRKDCRTPARSPGPCRASWAEAGGTEAWRDARDEVRAQVGGGAPAACLRDVPRRDRFKSGSASLPAPATQAGKAPRKGKSRTLDNSDLNSLSEDLARSGEAQQGQRGAASKDRKMLKFISGIFTKSNSGPVGSAASAAPVFVRRDSSEEEGR